MHSVRNWETGSRKRDWRVHPLGRGPKGRVTMEWEGWLSLRALAEPVRGGIVVGAQA